MIQEHFAKFISEFYGYGEWSALDWFLGIEEGGGGNIEHVNQKMQQFFFWNSINDGLVDNFEFQSLLEECKNGRFLDASYRGPAAQSTWIHLLKALILKRTGNWPDLQDAKLSQISNLGRVNSYNINSALIELFPLPNPGINQTEFERWFDWTSHFSEDWRMPRERYVYENTIIENRINFIRQKLILHKPKNVIAYIGTNVRYFNFLSMLISTQPIEWVEVEVDSLPNKNILYHDIIHNQNQITRIFRCYHPSRTNNAIYWKKVGELML
jgi:hypothetical protein